MKRSDAVPSLWRCVSLTVSLPKMGGRVQHELDGVRNVGTSTLHADRVKLGFVGLLDCRGSARCWKSRRLLGSFLFYLWDAWLVRSSEVSIFLLQTRHAARTKRLSVDCVLNGMEQAQDPSLTGA